MRDVRREWKRYVTTRGTPVQAKHMKDEFRITNEQGFERNGSSGDWLTKSYRGYLICEDSIFKANYIRKEFRE